MLFHAFWLRLSSHCRLKWPKSFFCPNVTHIWFSYDSLNSTNPIFPNQAQATFICGPKSDTYPMFCHATSVWTAISHFMQFLRHWNATDITILSWRSREDLNHNGRQYIDNNITSLFRLRLHINLKIANHTLTGAVSIFISTNSALRLTSCLLLHMRGSLQGRIWFTQETDGSCI